MPFSATGPLPPKHNMNIVGVASGRLKQQADGTIERDKARKVPKGKSQQSGIDFFLGDCQSSVVKPTNIRTVLTRALSHDWPAVGCLQCLGYAHNINK